MEVIEGTVFAVICLAASCTVAVAGYFAVDFGNWIWRRKS